MSASSQVIEKLETGVKLYRDKLHRIANSQSQLDMERASAEKGLADWQAELDSYRKILEKRND